MSAEPLRRALGSARLILAPALVAGALSAILCLGLMALDLYYHLQRDLAAMQARTEVVLDGIDEVLQAVAPRVAHARCGEAIETLRHYAAFDHRVRSLALVEGDRVFCTSLFPGDEYRLLDVADPQAPIRLLDGTPRWPQSPALTMRYDRGGVGVLAFISERTLMSAVPASGHGTTLIHIGSASLSVDRAASAASLDAVWLSDSLPVRPGVWVQRVVSRQQALDRLGEVWPSMLVLTVLVVALVGWLYGRAYRRGGVLPNQLRSALARRQFVPFYQPIVSRAPGYPVVGFEVLIRWIKPGEGVIAPADFLPVAERSGLLLPMTDALMEQVIAAVKAGPVLQGKILSLNLAAGHLRDSLRVIALAQRFLTGTSGTGARLTLEISERSIKADLAACQETLERVKAMGVHLSVDDFCTGNANLDTLCAMRFDNVKCDRFVAGLINCGDQREVIPAGVVDLIHQLGFAVVVEGIESAEQAEFFAVRGVSFLQGYYFGRPMPYAELVAWLARHEARFSLVGEAEAAKAQPV